MSECVCAHGGQRMASNALEVMVVQIQCGCLKLNPGPQQMLSLLRRLSSLSGLCFQLIYQALVLKYLNLLCFKTGS